MRTAILRICAAWTCLRPTSKEPASIARAFQAVLSEKYLGRRAEEVGGDGDPHPVAVTAGLIHHLGRDSIEDNGTAPAYELSFAGTPYAPRISRLTAFNRQIPKTTTTAAGDETRARFRQGCAMRMLDLALRRNGHGYLLSVYTI